MKMYLTQMDPADSVPVCTCVTILNLFWLHTNKPQLQECFYFIIPDFLTPVQVSGNAAQPIGLSRRQLFCYAEIFHQSAPGWIINWKALAGYWEIRLI